MVTKAEAADNLTASANEAIRTQPRLPRPVTEWWVDEIQRATDVLYNLVDPIGLPPPSDISIAYLAGVVAQEVAALQERAEAAEARLQEREEELNRLRKQTHTLMRDEIGATWTAIENGYDIEPRAYFEKEAPRNGFRFALAQAIHHIWKRDPKVAELEREVARLIPERDGASMVARDMQERLEHCQAEVARLRGYVQHKDGCKTNICGEMGCMTLKQNHSIVGQHHVFKPLFTCTCLLDPSVKGEP